jgi:hypothetical protein
LASKLACVAFALSTLAAAACGEDPGATSGSEDTSSSSVSSSSSTTVAATTTTATALVCPTPVEVASGDELVAALGRLEWAGLGPYSSGTLPITPDILVSGTVVIVGREIPLPEGCAQRIDCLAVAAFQMGQPVPGVALTGPIEPGGAGDGSVLTLTDATLRLRPVMYDMHPGRYNAVPLIAILPPCGSPCPSGQLLCPADGSCYPPGESYCRFCQGKDKEQCACEAPEGPLLEGSYCQFWQSGDVLCPGTCQQGACRTGPCP